MKAGFRCLKFETQAKKIICDQKRKAWLWLETNGAGIHCEISGAYPFNLSTIGLSVCVSWMALEKANIPPGPIWCFGTLLPAT